jgi:preprotein translocase subunit YajC
MSDNDKIIYILIVTQLVMLVLMMCHYVSHQREQRKKDKNH